MKTIRILKTVSAMLRSLKVKIKLVREVLEWFAGETYKTSNVF